MLLALTMGSGKTRIAIETVQRLAEEGRVVGGAVFGLKSTKFQWQREIEKWAPGATSIVINGTPKKRLEQYQSAYQYRYTILNYDALVHDWDLIQEFLPIDFLICDEVTAIKSFTARRSRRMKALGKHSSYRFGMSGQPVENRPEELFSIMEFVDRGVLGKFDKFDRTFITRDHWGRPRNYKNLDLLHRSLSEAMFRRSRDDIAQYLPRLNTMDSPVELDSWSKKLYDYIRLDLLDIIELAIGAGMGGFDLLANYGRSDNDDGGQMKGAIMSRVTAMRLLCDHPQLLLKSADDFDDEEVAGGSQYASDLRAIGKLDKVPNSSAKLEALLEKVEDILSDPSAKVVVFSGFKAMLGIIEAEVTKLGYESTLISGDVSAALRDERIVRFNNDPGCRVFLSSDAGAYGVNLDSGTHLISYDLPWSAGSFAQRVARIDRTSSKHESIVVDSMFSLGTIEERQYAMLQQKRRISEAFIDGKFSVDGSMALSLESLREFLLSS